MSGTLYLVATPIGNLEDITLRALRILKEVDYIACEDTRHTLKLLNHYEIKKPLHSYHEHNKMEKGLQIIQDLKQGLNVALVTDAGTPAISDPGEDLVKLCYEHAIEFTAIPGPVALITSLILSGQSTRRFAYEGFLPTAKKERRVLLENISQETRTIILYEAPHKLKQTLHDLYQALGNRQITLTRELTKRFEEKKRVMLEQAIQFYEENEVRGEFVIVIEGLSTETIAAEKKEAWLSMSLDEHHEFYIKQGLTDKDAIKAVAKDRELNKRDVYLHFHGNSSC